MYWCGCMDCAAGLCRQTFIVDISQICPVFKLTSLCNCSTLSRSLPWLLVLFLRMNARVSFAAHTSSRHLKVDDHSASGLSTQYEVDQYLPISALYDGIQNQVCIKTLLHAFGIVAGCKLSRMARNLIGQNQFVLSSISHQSAHFAVSKWHLPDAHEAAAHQDIISSSSHKLNWLCMFSSSQPSQGAYYMTS